MHSDGHSSAAQSWSQVRWRISAIVRLFGRSIAKPHARLHTVLHRRRVGGLGRAGVRRPPPQTCTRGWVRVAAAGLLPGARLELLGAHAVLNGLHGERLGPLCGSQGGGAGAAVVGAPAVQPVACGTARLGAHRTACLLKQLQSIQLQSSTSAAASSPIGRPSARLHTVLHTTGEAGHRWAVSAAQAGGRVGGAGGQAHMARRDGAEH